MDVRTPEVRARAFIVLQNRRCLASASRLFARRRLGRGAPLVAKRARCHVTRPPKRSRAAFLRWFGDVTRRPTGGRSVSDGETNRRSEYECNVSAHFQILFE